MNQMRRRVAACAVLVLLALGCGSPTGAVSGKITVGSKPLPRGLITFLPQTGNRDPFNAAIVNGEYRREGVPCGKALIAIIGSDTTSETGPPKKTGRSDLNPTPKPRWGQKMIIVPARYHSPDKSGFQIDIKKGENTFNADLKR
jgi:hypothetical protein